MSLDATTRAGGQTAPGASEGPQTAKWLVTKITRRGESGITPWLTGDLEWLGTIVAVALKRGTPSAVEIRRVNRRRTRTPPHPPNPTPP